MSKRKKALPKFIEPSDEIARAMHELEKIGSGILSVSWPGERGILLPPDYYKDTLKPTFTEMEKVYKGSDVSGTFIDETAKISPEDFDRMAKYWKTREKEIGGGWLVPDDARDELLRRSKAGEDISKYFEIPRDEMSIYGSSPLWSDYLTDHVGINPDKPDLKNRLDQLMSNSEWVDYHQFVGNLDMWAGYLGDGYWITSVKTFKSDAYLRPWCLIFWRDHDDVFSWLHSEFPDGSIVLADDQDNTFYDEHFSLIRKLAKYAQIFLQRFAEGEMSEEWTGHDD